MPTLEEMTTWTTEDIEAAISQALPPGWTFEYGCDDERDGWGVIKDGEGEVRWDTATIPDERLLLFNAYGWLLSRTAQPRHPVWARRKGDVPRPVVGQYSLPGVSVPDPEDLDPAEVAAVYDDLRAPKRR